MAPNRFTSTVGIDLAARAKNTAFCAIRWGDDRPVLTHLCLGRSASSEDGIDLHDKYLVNVVLGRYQGFETAPITKVAIDSPFGWPESFVEGVATYEKTGTWNQPMDFVDVPERVNALRFRRTDLEVKEKTGRTPLSVSSTLLGTVAMRCAAILSELQHNEVDVRRDGQGMVAEVYPDPALRRWTGHLAGGLPKTGGSYKGGKGEVGRQRKELRRRLCAALTEPIRLDDPNGLLSRCADEDHCLDALVCALLARAVELGQTVEPPAELQEAAEREGWIHLPSLPVSDLAA